MWRANLDEATLESGQFAVAKLLLERFARGERVGQSEVLQFCRKTNLEPSRHAEEEGEVKPGSVVSNQDNILLLCDCRAPPAHLYQYMFASCLELPEEITKDCRGVFIRSKIFTTANQAAIFDLHTMHHCGPPVD